MKKTFDYHDPRAKNVIIKAMTESHMNHHYRKIRNVNPYVDTNMRKKVSRPVCSSRCQCGNRIFQGNRCVRRNYQQNEYKRNVDLGLICKKYAKCLETGSTNVASKPANRMGQSKLKFLTEVYHPPRTRLSVSSRNEDRGEGSDSDSDEEFDSGLTRNPNLDYIELLKKITDDILNYSLYTSSQLKSLFQQHLASNQYSLTQEEMIEKINSLEQELKFTEESLTASPRFHVDRSRIDGSKSSPFDPGINLDDLNIDVKTLSEIKEALHIRQTEDCWSQTYLESALPSEGEQDDPNHPNKSFMTEVTDRESLLVDATDKQKVVEHVNPDLVDHAASRSESRNDSENSESLEDLSSIHSYQD